MKTKKVLNKVSFDKAILTNGVANKTKGNGKFTLFLFQSFMRYCNGDWGKMSEEDKQLNEIALTNGGRVMGRYEFDNNIENVIYIIVESDREKATILLAMEY